LSFIKLSMYEAKLTLSALRWRVNSSCLSRFPRMILRWEIVVPLAREKFPGVESMLFTTLYSSLLTCPSTLPRFLLPVSIAEDDEAEGAKLNPPAPMALEGAGAGAAPKEKPPEPIEPEGAGAGAPKENPPDPIDPAAADPPPPPPPLELDDPPGFAVSQETHLDVAVGGFITMQASHFQDPAAGLYFCGNKKLH
jgi:hypothetical protein